jgi:hypothetical protein
LLFGVPHGFSPPEKLGKLRHTIDLMLFVEKTEEGMSIDKTFYSFF